MPGERQQARDSAHDDSGTEQRPGEGDQPCPICGEQASQVVDVEQRDPEDEDPYLLVTDSSADIPSAAQTHIVLVGDDSGFLYVHTEATAAPISTGDEVVRVADGGVLHARAYYGAMRGDEDYFVTPCGQRGRLEDEGVEVYDHEWDEVPALVLDGGTERCQVCRSIVE